MTVKQIKRTSYHRRPPRKLNDLKHNIWWDREALKKEAKSYRKKVRLKEISEQYMEYFEFLDLE